jgi:hypothetical protein
MKQQINEIRRMQQLAGIISESQSSKKPVPKFETVWEIIDYFDEIPSFEEYKNKEASYDDTYFEIPADVFSKELGWTEEDIDQIDNNLESYEGSINWLENEIVVTGGA